MRKQILAELEVVVLNYLPSMSQIKKQIWVPESCVGTTNLNDGVTSQGPREDPGRLQPADHTEHEKNHVFLMVIVV